MSGNQVNTRDDNGDYTSNLDPIAFLFDKNGKDLLGVADDNLTCARDPVCGYACPQIGPIALKKGRYTVVIRDYNRATTTGVQCNGGAYTLSVTGNVKRLKLAKDDKNVILNPQTERVLSSTLMEEITSSEKLESILEHDGTLDSIE